MSDIINYLDGALGDGTYHNTSRGTQYSYKCPFCGDYKERMFVHPGRQRYVCHNCGKAGTLISLISDYAHIPWGQALKVYREHEGYDKELPESLEQEIYEKLYSNTQIDINKYVYPLPEEFTLVENATGKAGQQAVKYLKGRGVTLEMCEKYYIGYCAEGEYANRIIMTDFENGELVYWQGRTWLSAPSDPMLKKFFRKAMNPSLTEEQKEQGIIAVDKSEIISNIDFILKDGVAVVCEGRMDAYALRDAGACTHGKAMSDAQFMKLVTNKDKIEVVYVMYDGDAFDATLRTAKRLSKHFDDVYICHLPYKEDPSSLGYKGCIEVINEAIKYTPLVEARCRLKGWI